MYDDQTSAHMLSIMREWNLLIFKVIGQGHEKILCCAEMLHWLAFALSLDLWVFIHNRTEIVGCVLTG